MIAQTNRVTLCPICHTSNRSDARFCQKCGNNIWLNDRYRIIRAIKEGGQGAVYEALDETGKRYALKALIDRFTDPTERKHAIERFEEEASILRELKHPRIPCVYSDFVHGGRYYLAMDFIEGDDLEDLVSRQPLKRFDEPTVMRWADQIADVLDYLHVRRLIYRDMKPSNVMIERSSGSVKLVDFGIAKLFQPNERNTLIGTPGYSPPEQYQGLATPQSDVFALGATLHHLLTGRDPRDEPPFSFPPVRELVPAVSVASEQAIMKALVMEPSKRWPSAAAFRAALPLELGSRGNRKPAQPQGTVTLPPLVAPSVAPIPQVQRVPVPPRAQPKPRAAKPPLAPPLAPPQKRPVRWWLPLLIISVVGGLIGLGQPGVGDQLEGLINGSATLPTVAPVPTPGSGQSALRPYTKEITVMVPLTSTDNEIFDAFRQEYETQAKADFGPETRVSPSGLSYLGPRPAELSSDATSKTLKVTMTGRIAVP